MKSRKKYTKRILGVYILSRNIRQISSFVFFALGAAFFSANALGDDLYEVSVARETKDISAINNLLKVLASASKENNEQGVLVCLAPSLKAEMDETGKKIEGIDQPVRVIRTAWTNSFGRVTMSRLDSPHDIYILKKYPAGKCLLWEVFINYTSDTQKMANLWYFVEDRDAKTLLIVDWPFGGNPDHSVKKFDLNRGN